MMDFTDMTAWQKAFQLLTGIYKITKEYPQDERFGIISDMRRAANSVAHNIAEGFGRFESKDKTRFYKISRGSAYELISQVLVSRELNYLSENDKITTEKELREIIAELTALIKAIEAR